MGYKDGLQSETLADGNWLVKHNQPVSKIETKSDTNLRSLYEFWFRNALISKSVILWWQAKKGINSELEGANARRVLNIPSKRSLYLMCSSHTSAHLQKKSTCFSSRTSPHSHLTQMLEPPCHLQDSTFKWCARNLNLLKFLNTCLSKSLYKKEGIEEGEPLGPLSELPHHLWHVTAFLFTARGHEKPASLHTFKCLKRKKFYFIYM